jgi:RHS repeat-associated protein
VRNVCHKLEFVYDYMGRRVKKTVYDYSAGSWQLNEEKLFVYDGWNLVEEITVVGTTETSRYFVWGLDLSQSLQGAGGIGGLLATVDGADTYYFAYDGNGNVGQVIDASFGIIAASYQYDPFGNLIKADGAYADDNPFRFSTKYHDDETGLVYYGYRYYSTELGRWLNRDPIGKTGGVNEYNFLKNQVENDIDILWLTGFWDYYDDYLDDPDAIEDGIAGEGPLTDPYPYPEYEDYDFQEILEEIILDHLSGKRNRDLWPNDSLWARSYKYYRKRRINDFSLL